MSRMHTKATATAVTAVVCLSLIALVGPPATAGPPSDDAVTVATDLNNPRQLSIGPGGALYIAEAGTADSCAPVLGVAPEVEVCGLTGSITAVRHGHQRRVVTDLPTMTLNGEVVGASDVIVRGNRIAVLTGGPTVAASVRDSLPVEYADLGTLRTGSLRSVPISGDALRLAADVSAYEVANNPDHNDPPDTNAAGFAALNAHRWAVTDAGGNTLLMVGRHGERTIAVFPAGAPVPNPFGPGEVAPQAVPTDVAIGPDDAYYVSQLTGFPFPTGGSTIWRVTRNGDVSAYATGLTMVTSLAWKGRTLYAVQLDDGNFFDGHVGSLRRVTPGGSVHEAIATGLSAPYGLAIRGHSAFISVDSTSSGGGSVIRLDLR